MARSSGWETRIDRPSGRWSTNGTNGRAVHALRICSRVTAVRLADADGGLRRSITSEDNQGWRTRSPFASARYSLRQSSSEETDGDEVERGDEAVVPGGLVRRPPRGD